MAQVAVIGAGFGGLAAALRLRAAGFEVAIYDNQHTAGGRAGVYQRDGYTFDAGPTVITAPFLIDELFALFGKRREDYVTFQPLTPWYRIRFADGRSFEYGGTLEQTLQEVSRFSPGDVAGYRKLLRAVEQVYRVGFEQLGAQPFDSLYSMLRVLPQMAMLRSDRSVYDFVARYLKDDSLRRVFSFQPLLVGGNPFHTTSIYSLIQHLERKAGVHFAMGGTAALVQALVRLLDEQGVQLHLSVEVKKIEVVDGSVHGLHLQDGSYVPSDVVVANADAPAVYRNLLDPQWRRKWSNRRIESRKYSMGLFVMYLGVRRQYPDLAHHTILLGTHYRELLEDIFKHGILNDDLSLYLHAPTRTDASLAPAGCESMYVLAPVPNLQASIDWAAEKPRLEQRILDILERTVCPGITDALQVRFSVTPEHFRDNLLTHHGTGFSIQPTLLQSAWFRFHNRSEDVDGLYLVGAGTHPGAGIPGVLCSAKVLEHYVPEMLAQARSTAKARANGASQPRDGSGIPLNEPSQIAPGLKAASAAQVMAASAKTFNGAARLLPLSIRTKVQALYAFCRRVDDLADAPGTDPSNASEVLLRMEAELAAGGGDICAELGWTLPGANELLTEAASALVRTVRTDLSQLQPPTSRELEQYAFGVAGTVGLMMAELCGADRRGLPAALSLGIAMQITNIVRDVAADYRAGRIYLPADWITAEELTHALSGDGPAEHVLQQATLRALRLAEGFYRHAYAGIWALPARARWSILAAALCYREIGVSVARDIPASWRRRTVVSRGRKLWLLLRAGAWLLHPRFWRRPAILIGEAHAQASALRMCRAQTAV